MDRLTQLTDELHSRQLKAELPKLRRKKQQPRFIDPEGKVAWKDMSPDDPLYEMLPSPDKIKALKWITRSSKMRDLARYGPKESLLDTHSKAIRVFLSECGKGSNKTRFQRVLENAFEISTSKSPQAIKAAEFLFDRGFGTSSPGQEELAARRQGLQVVHVIQPVINRPVEEYKPPKEAEPKFLTARFEEAE